MKSGLSVYGLKDRNILPNTLPDEHIPQETEILTETIKWLDMYFSGEGTELLLRHFILPARHSDGQCGRFYYRFPMGRTITYGEIARKIAETKNTSRMSAQAVGGAVGT